MSKMEESPKSQPIFSCRPGGCYVIYVGEDGVEGIVLMRMKLMKDGDPECHAYVIDSRQKVQPKRVFHGAHAFGFLFAGSNKVRFTLKKEKREALSFLQINLTLSVGLKAQQWEVLVREKPALAAMIKNLIPYALI